MSPLGEHLSMVKFEGMAVNHISCALMDVDNLLIKNATARDTGYMLEQVVALYHNIIANSNMPE